MFGSVGQAGSARIDEDVKGRVINQSTSGYNAAAAVNGAWYVSLCGISFPIGA
jgi:hypothetical protein